jgi:hypothetical protein
MLLSNFVNIRINHLTAGAGWLSGQRHQSVLTLNRRSWVQISAPPMYFLLDEMNNGASNNNRASINNRASNNNRVAKARSRQLKRKANN